MPMVATLLIASVLTATDGTELIRDRHFEQGFQVFDPKTGAQVVRDTFQWSDSGAPPVWGLAQWSSKHSLAGATMERLPSCAVRFANAAKTVTVGPGGAKGPELSLAVDARVEWWGVLRKPGEDWPHLLVSQELPACPMLDELSALDFTVTARLVHAERVEPEGYDPHHHAAQYMIFFTVQNRNKASAGYGDFLWLGVQIYDDRGRPELSMVGGDQELGKFIYTPARADYTDGDITSGEWVTYAADLLPLAKRALDAAWARGFLKDSQALGDYRLNGLSLGWEVPGINNVVVAVRDLSLHAVRREPEKGGE